MKLFGFNIGSAKLSAPNPFKELPVGVAPNPGNPGNEGKVLAPFMEKQPPVEDPPRKQAIYLNPRWEPINISQNSTAQSIQTAIREAENGETRELFRFYRDIILGDDHVQGCINARKICMLSMPINFMPQDKNNPDDVEAAAACRRAKDDCENWNDAMSTMLSSCFWPVKIMERLYRPADEARSGEPKMQWTLRKFEDVNPMLFCFRWSYLTGGIAMGTASPIQQAGLGLTPGNFMIDLEVWEPFFKLWPTDNSGRIIYDCASAQYLDRSRHIVHRNHLLTEFRDNWGGPGRAITGWWLLRQLGRDWFAQFMQTYGKPFVKMKVDVEDQDAIDFARQALDVARRIGGLVIDHEDEAELVAAMVQGGAEGHKTWGEVCNGAISRLICGQEMASTAKSGSETGSSQAKLQGSVREDIAQFDQQKLGETVVKQICNPFLLLNGLPGRVTANWGGQSGEEAEKTGSLLLSLSQAGLTPADDQLPVISERVGFTVQRVAPPEMMDEDPSSGLRPPSPSGRGQGEGAPLRTPAQRRQLCTGSPEGSGAAQLHAALTLLDVAARSTEHSALRTLHPSDVIAARHAPALAGALAARYAAIPEIIRLSATPEDARKNIRAYIERQKLDDATGQIIASAMQAAADTQH
jgi:hypothetical protein